TRIAGDASADWAARRTTVATSAAPATVRSSTYLDLDRFPAQLLEPSSQTLVEPDLRFPAENLARPRDVRPADERVVHRQRLEDDLARRACDADARLGELEHRQLVVRV